MILATHFMLTEYYKKKSFNYNINSRAECIVHLKLKEQYKMALMCHQTLRIHVHFNYLHH